MARITGKNGQIKIGGSVIATITNWTLDAKIPLADATAMGDQFWQKLSLIREWSGDVKGVYGNAAEQISILNSFLNATTDGGPTSGSVTIALYPDATSPATENFSGSCYMDFSTGADKSKTNEFTAKFTGTGTLTHTA